MREKIQGTIRYLNELSLGQRINAIISTVSKDFGGTPPAWDKKHLRKLVDTRNYYTHFSKDLEKKVLDGAEMYWAGRRIVLLLSLLFLRRLQIPADDLTRLLKRHQEFARLWATEGDPYETK